MSSASAGRAEKAEARVGAVLAGRYRLTRVLGTGGMGSVYEAVHLTTEKRVAVKLLAGNLSKDLKLVARFRREAMAASKIEHENCVHVDDFGEDGDGTFYIAMELVNGRGLADELRASGPMPPARVARIGVQLLKALDAAHVCGVLHRDLKPQNVMLTQKAGRPDIVKVVDFGIAKLTNHSAEDQQALTIPGTIFGTPEYMSPEQARGEVLDARSDLYSAAVVLWHMLLGRSPFRGTSVRDTLMKVFSEVAPSPTLERPGVPIPPGFEGVLQRAMAKNKDDRWADAAVFAAALSRYADGVVLDLPTRARPGLPQGGEAPAATLEKMPAVSVPMPGSSSSMPLPRDTVPLPAVDASIPPATDVATRFASPSVMLSQPPPPAARPSTPPPVSSVLSPAPSPLSSPLSSLSSSAATVAEQPAVQIPAGPQKEARVVTLDAVKRQTAPEAPRTLPTPPPARRRDEKISVAALIVIIGGLLLLGAAVFVGVLVAQGTLLAPTPQDQHEKPVIGVGATTTTTTTTTPPRDPTALQKALASTVPLDPQARDAAIGRAERAVADNRTDDARRAFEEAVAADPTAPAALIGLGTTAMRQNDYPAARDAFEKLISIDKVYRKQFGPMHARAKKLAESAQ